MENKVLYQREVKKNNIFNLCKQVLVLIIVLFLVFVPIYKCNCTKTDTFHFNSAEEEIEAALEFLVKGYLPRNFSLIDELSITYANLIETEDFFIFIFETATLHLVLIFAFFITLRAVKQMVETIKALIHSEDVKRKPLRMRWVLAFAFIDFVFSFSAIADGDKIYDVRHIQEFGGFSVFGYILLILIIANVVIGSIIKHQNKKLSLTVAREDYPEQQSDVEPQSQEKS